MFGRHRLDQYDPAFFFRHWVVEDAARHDMHRSFRQMDRFASFVLNPQAPAYDIEQFVFTRVAVPHKFAPYLRDFHILVIDLRYDLGRPVFCDGVERGLQIDGAVLERHSPGLVGALPQVHIRTFVCLL